MPPMAPKGPSLLEEPPACSSSEEEETSSGEENEDASNKVAPSLLEESPACFSSEEEDTPTGAEKEDSSNQGFFSSKEKEPQEFSSESGSDSDAEADKSLKPLPSKWMEETYKQRSSSSSEEADYMLKKIEPSTSSSAGKKLSSKNQHPPLLLQWQESSSESPKSLSGSDFHLDAEANKGVLQIAWKPMDFEKTKMSGRLPKRKRDSKQGKKDSDVLIEDGAAVEDDSKPKGDKTTKIFQRLWTEEDEITVLKRIKDYWTQEGANASKNIKKFHDFIRNSLQVDVSTKQLKDKVHKLKRKYRKNLKRGQNGEDPIFTQAHEKKVFDLSKKLWCNREGEVLFKEQPKLNGSPTKNEKASSSRNIPSECWNELFDYNKKHGVSVTVLKRGLEFIEESKKKVMEEEWDEFYCTQLKLLAKRTELLNDQAKLVWKAYEASRSKG